MQEHTHGPHACGIAHNEGGGVPEARFGIDQIPPVLAHLPQLNQFAVLVEDLAEGGTSGVGEV